MDLSFLGFFEPMDGYGEATIEIGRALLAQCPDLNLFDMRPPEGSYTGLPLPDELRYWDVRPGRALALCVPKWYPFIDAKRLIGYTMFEATRLPAGWAEAIERRCDQLVTPCEWCAEMFRENGVKAPIEVVGWGINTDDFFPIQRCEDKEVYTFLWSGTPDLRKGWDVAYRAFRKAFGDRRDVELIMHFRNALPGDPKFVDKNVKALVGKLDRYAWRSLLARVDCFVFPSRGEGWGLPPREAAATGLPVIVTNYGGLAVDCEHWALPIPITGYSTAAYGWWDAGTIGEWVEPDVDVCISMMQWCAAHPATARDIGEEGARWLSGRTWGNVASDLLELFG